MWVASVSRGGLRRGRLRITYNDFKMAEKEKPSPKPDGGAPSSNPSGVPPAKPQKIEKGLRIVPDR